MENSVNRNRVTHIHEVVKNLVHWFDDKVFSLCPTWEDYLRGGFLTTPELEKFFGEARKGENGNLVGDPGNYAQCVERGIGRKIIAKMLAGTAGVEEIRKAIENFPMSDRRRHQ